MACYSQTAHPIQNPIEFLGPLGSPEVNSCDSIDLLTCSILPHYANEITAHLHFWPETLPIDLRSVWNETTIKNISRNLSSYSAGAAVDAPAQTRSAAKRKSPVQAQPPALTGESGFTGNVN